MSELRFVGFQDFRILLFRVRIHVECIERIFFSAEGTTHNSEGVQQGETPRAKCLILSPEGAQQLLFHGRIQAEHDKKIIYFNSINRI